MIYVVMEMHPFEGGSAPYAIFDSIEKANIFAAACLCTRNDYVKIYEYEINKIYSGYKNHIGEENDDKKDGAS